MASMSVKSRFLERFRMPWADLPRATVARFKSVCCLGLEWLIPEWLWIQCPFSCAEYISTTCFLHSCVFSRGLCSAEGFCSRGGAVGSECALETRAASSGRVRAWSGSAGRCVSNNRSGVSVAGWMRSSTKWGRSIAGPAWYLSGLQGAGDIRDGLLWQAELGRTLGVSQAGADIDCVEALWAL